MQRFLETHPQLLIQLLTTGRGAFVLPKVRLGSEYEADFLIAYEASGGLVWCAVELESPRAKVFTKKGDPSPFSITRFDRLATGVSGFPVTETMRSGLVNYEVLV
jgi:hypothetical protein